MKKLMLILAIVLMGCSQPKNIVDYEHIPDPEVIADDPELIYVWSKNYSSWEFFADGEFIYWDNNSGEIYNNGFYVIGPNVGMIYVEDYFNGEVAAYNYTILQDYPLAGDVTLDWNPGEFLRE